jgi:Holliday junction resolvasome RuvABC endonuclease subunit
MTATATAESAASLMSGLSDQTVYIGIDPSLTGTGVCILDAYGGHSVRTIKTTPKTHPNIYRRIDCIVNAITEIAGRHADPRICIERVFVSPKNMNSQQHLIVLGYMIRRMLFWGGLMFIEVSPMTLKKFVCGNGKAEKSMMLMRVYQHWDVSADDDNQADAVGLAHMAQAIEGVRDGGDLASWPKYQVEIVQGMLAKEGAV